jgi:hypothetical protein
MVESSPPRRLELWVMRSNPARVIALKTMGDRGFVYISIFGTESGGQRVELKFWGNYTICSSAKPLTLIFHTFLSQQKNLWTFNCKIVQEFHKNYQVQLLLTKFANFRGDNFGRFFSTERPPISTLSEPAAPRRAHRGGQRGRPHRREVHQVPVRSVSAAAEKFTEKFYPRNPRISVTVFSNAAYIGNIETKCNRPSWSKILDLMTRKTLKLLLIRIQYTQMNEVLFISSKRN